MRDRWVWALHYLLVLVFTWSPLLVIADVGRAELSSSLQEALNQVVSLQRTGNAVQSYRLLKGVLEKMDDADVAAANDYLTNAGADRLETLLIGLRSQIVTSRDGKKLRSAKGLEARLLVDGLYGMINQLLADIEGDLPARALPVASADEVKAALQRCASASDRMGQIYYLFDDLVVVGRNLPRSNRETLAPAIAEAVGNRFEDLRMKIEQTQRLGDAQLCELHFRNIESTLAQSVSDAAPLKERLAYVSQVADSIDAIRRREVELSQGHKNEQRKSAEIDERLAPLLMRFHRDLSKERKIAYELEAGKRWWIRGRYGKGVARLGLLKEKASSRGSNEKNLLAQPLFMPNPLPSDHDVVLGYRANEPVISYIQAIHPTVTRRHYVLWGSFSTDAATDSKVAYFIHEPPTGTLEYAYLAEEDPEVGVSIRTGTLADPVVGFVEYQMALLHFNRLLGLLSDDEKEEIDALVGEDHRLSYFSYVSRLYDWLSADSSLRDPFKVNNGKYDRSSLRWAMALARMEIAAMDAACRSPDADPPPRDPKESLAFDHREYRELLWDAARVHYYSMRYYLPIGKSEGSFHNGVLISSLNPKEDFIFLRQEYILALNIGADLRTLFEKDEDVTPAMFAELDSWLGFLVPAEKALRGIVARQYLVSPNFGQAMTIYAPAGR